MLYQAIIYKVSPIVIVFEPESTINMLLSKPKLRTANILPALLRYCSALDNQYKSGNHDLPLDVDFDGNKVNFAIKYLQVHK